MADTWHITSLATVWAATKNMLDLWNDAASAKTLRVYRMFCFNDQLTAITGLQGFCGIWRLTAAPTVGSTVTPVAHRSSNAALDANTTAGTGRTITRVSQFRQFSWASDEVAAGALNVNALETYVPFAEIWNSGYGDSNVDPLTCRASNAEGLVIGGPSGLTNGSASLEMEFTSS